MIERRLNNQFRSFHEFFLLKNKNSQKEFSKKSDEGFEKKTKNKFTILFDIEPPKDRNVLLKLGENFIFEIDQECKITLNKNENYLEKKKIEEKIVKLLHFQDSKSFIWLSVRACDYHKPEENFVKIGYGDLMERNILAYYTETNEGLHSFFSY